MTHLSLDPPAVWALCWFWCSRSDSEMAWASAKSAASWALRCELLPAMLLGELESCCIDAASARAKASSSLILPWTSVGLLPSRWFDGWLALFLLANGPLDPPNLAAAASAAFLLSPAALPSQRWSVGCLCFKQKLSRHSEQLTGIISFALQPFAEHLLEKTFLLVLAVSELQLLSMCAPTEISGCSPLLVKTGLLHKGHTGTWTSFL